MKKLLITLVTLALSLTAFAQSPERMSYQAVVRDAANKLVSNGPIGMAISIHQGSATGTVVYAETHTTMTNDNGLVSLEIGNGTPTMGTMAGIDWTAGPFFLETETDPTGGTNYTISGTSQFASVPYSMHSTTADHAATADLSTYAIDAQYAANSGSADTATYALTAGFAYAAQSATNAQNAVNAQNAARADVADSTAVAAFAYDTPIRRRSFMITPSMINSTFMVGATHAKLWYTWSYYPVIDMPDGSVVDVKLSWLMPSDYAGGGFTVKVLYVSTDTVGNFTTAANVRGVTPGLSLNQGQGGGGLTLPAPAGTDILGEGSVNVNVGVNANTRQINCVYRRRGADASDTSTGTLRVLGWIIEYNAK